MTGSGHGRMASVSAFTSSPRVPRSTCACMCLCSRRLGRESRGSLAAVEALDAARELLSPMERALERVRAGEDDPPCRTCGGILKSATISFGQNLVADDLMRAQVAAETCDLLLAVGSTLTVYPAAGMVPIAKEAGAALLIVNGEPTPFDPIADAVLQDSISEVLPALIRP